MKVVIFQRFQEHSTINDLIVWWDVVCARTTQLAHHETALLPPGLPIWVTEIINNMMYVIFVFLLFLSAKLFVCID